ncbi:hypothetical protein PONTUS_46 [Vibrio phage Pontus]|uniref:Uncharacterized protein n=3 Tax=Thalassavirus TaxID=2948922 RepID=A0A2H5BH10_9CAUD|nr:hypothetical protein FDJ20_gp048 [Vibrio phage Thalassa]YP_010102667.1 hypothetical protein KNU59_gp046 [Vibrio phage Pontus]YP_010114218.1 hypothetical protein KNV71_gp048 [Vibrio phage Gary]AUG85250.1 hypothetical protein THALASSA_48 [Vibrio phage Thalassa]QDF14695.1 hypothetical protein PONTUS_46 [Vibrio phage Pontus]QQV88152.1 hypothetical protein GARY_48 [Vibrio phage Gary]
MVLYDFNKIWLLSGGQPRLMLRYFKYLYLNRVDFRFLKGTNFILNPEIVVNNPMRLPQHKLAEYLGLCALRNYANYQQYREVNLDMEYFPNYIPRQVVDENPLIAINKSKILFKYEENNL